MSGSVTGVQFQAAIYPFEGGEYILSGSNAGILQAQINTSLKGGVGSFSLVLAPGGPLGTNFRPTWTEILTPMSLVILSIGRGSYYQIVMIGTVISCQESQSWNAGSGVPRSIIVDGMDFGQFFSRASYYTTTFLGGAILAEPNAAAGLQAILGSSLFVGAPDQFGKAWYQQIMAGPGSIMESLQFTYKTSFLKFYDMTQQYWQPYGGDVSIPMADYFMLSDGTWFDKFNQVFPFPYYEFFVTTAPQTYYASGTAAGLTDATQSVSIPGFSSAYPQVVARVNPVPKLVPQSNGSLSIDDSAWQKLPTFYLDAQDYSGIQSNMAFNESEVRNFYVMNPTNMLATYGVNNGNNSPWVFSFAALADVASIHRYGYRPEISEIHWFADMTGAQAQTAAANGVGINDFGALVSQLTYHLASYFEPTPLMATGSVTTRLRPDVFIGGRFEFSPWKQQESWLFYIEGVQHNFNFGGQSTTTLTLSRGLPSSVYSDAALLTAMHQGNAQRINGAYEIGTPAGLGEALTPVNYQTATSVLGNIANLFAAPQYLSR